MKKVKKSASIRAPVYKMTVAATSQYDSDFYKWTKTQVNLLKKEEFLKLDMQHIIEEIESLGRSEKNKLTSHLTVLLMHMLKMEYQPKKRTKSWDLSIKSAKYQARRTLEQNPSLKSKWKEIVIDAYYTARLEAAKETNLDENSFPEECPWDVLSLIK